MGCGNCNGNCEHCGGCAGHLVVSQVEWALLQKLAEIPFLPVARKMSDDIPVYLEDNEETAEQYSLILQCLEKRGLISIDYDQPLAGFDDAAYAAYPIRGSFALTARGIGVVELLEINGIE